MNGQGRSPWVYVAIGCGGALLLGILAIVGVAAFGYRKAKQFEADMKDPKAREAKVKAVLGGDIPPGYHPVISLSVPFLMDMAMLGDRPLEDHGPGRKLERGFIYVKMITTDPKQGEDMRRYFEGKVDDPEFLRRSNIHVRLDEVLKRGSLDVSGQTTLYVAARGGLEMEKNSTNGLLDLIYVDCPQDDKQRYGIWFGPDPAPGKPAADADFTGSVVDEKVAQEFLGHFRLCH